MKAIFLDFDGLICDTERAAWRSWAELYASLGYEFPAVVWRRMTGRPDGERLAAAHLAGLTGRPLSAAALAYRRRRKRELSIVEPLRPGVAELLTTAGRRGMRLAVVSSSPADWVGGHLDRLGVATRFDPVVTGEQAARPKPAPDLYRHALAVTGFAAGDVLALEDSPTGVRAARSAGLSCVAVPSAVNDAIGLDDATLVLDSLARLDLDQLALIA